VFDDPQVKHLEMARPADHAILGEINLVGQAINMTRTPEPGRFRSATAELGEHTEEILAEIGYGANRITELKDKGVV
jgi:formyl-CoA transferase